MAVMDRRLQILLDAARYERVAAEAERTGRSVGALIRDAIDACYPVGDEARIRVAGQLLDLTSSPADEVGEGPADLKQAYEARLDGKPA